MNTEIEAKFLKVDHDKVRAVLRELGATCEQPMRLMKRVIIETPELEAKNAFVRVRDEGNQVTVTYKQMDAIAVDGAKEIEMTVDNFDTVVQLFGAAGLEYKSFQESKRETWRLGDAEIVLDEWPWLKPYIEIEGESEEAVRDVAVKLGFSWNEAVFGGVMSAYQADYPHLSETDTVANIKEVRFGDALPKLFQA